MAGPDNVTRARLQNFFESEFWPAHDRNALPIPDARTATATEYSAHQLGNISKKLDKIIELLQAKG